MRRVRFSAPKDRERKPPEISPLTGEALLIGGCPGGATISETMGALALPEFIGSEVRRELHSFRHLR